MSDRMTNIVLPIGETYNPGIAEYGRVSADEMIKRLREYMHRQFLVAEAVLMASDEDFEIYTCLGTVVERNKEYIQKSSLNKYD